MYFFSTLFIISLLHIDICYSSIIAESTVVDVVRHSGGERCRGLLVSSFRHPFSLSILLPTMYFSSTFIIIILLHIYRCCSSICANSTLVDVVQLSGGKGVLRCASLSPSSLSISLPTMYFFSTLCIINLLHIDMCYSSTIVKSTLVDVVRQSGGERCRALLFSSLFPGPSSLST